MSRKFLQERSVEACSERALIRRMSKVGDVLFGKTKSFLSQGREGSREYVWAIKVNDYNVYRPMTDDEEKIFDEIITNYYTAEPDRVKKKALLEETFLNSEEITKEEYKN